jgi:hypothetical protein
VALVGPGAVVGPQVTITTLTCQYAMATPPTGIGRTPDPKNRCHDLGKPPEGVAR